MRALVMGAILWSLGLGESRAQPGGPVEAQMRRVDFRLDPLVVLEIEFLRGRLVPTAPNSAPWFDDKRSFTIEIDSADVAISAASLSHLLNRHTFAYRGAPLRDLRVRMEGGATPRLVLQGRLFGIPFGTESAVRVTPQGDVLLRPSSIRALGIPVRSLMSFLGLSLEKLVDWSRARGIRARGNDLILSPTALLPDPRVRGHLAGVRLQAGAMRQTFRPAGGRSVSLLAVPDSAATNYMYYRGHTLRFGRLTMEPADLLIMDLHPADPFDFFLDRYRDQLAAGFSRTLPSGRLSAYLPDYRAVRRSGGQAAGR